MSKLLREYRSGDPVDAVCILAGLTVKQTRQQKAFLRLELGDAGGRVAAVMWEGFDEELTRIPPGTVLRVTGTMDEYDDQPQVLVKSISRPAPGSFDQASLLPSSAEDIGRMLEKLDGIIRTVSFPPLRKLLETMFGDKEFRERFSKAPAAKRWHQPYLGGLLEHTLNVQANALALSARYPEVEIDLVTGGALVHDIGKTVEYSWEGWFDTSTQGRLLGHLVIGVEMLDGWIRRQENFPEELGWHLKHIILSHHGQYEFGSPVLPRTLEALIVHFADDLDAKMNGVLKIYRREQEAPGEWTSYVKLMEREFFKVPVLSQATAGKEPSNGPRPSNRPPAASGRQETLFPDEN